MTGQGWWGNWPSWVKGFKAGPLEWQHSSWVWAAPEWGISGRGNGMSRSMEKRKREKKHREFLPPGVVLWVGAQGVMGDTDG